MPGLRKKISEFFNLTPESHIDPTRIVALGAAIQAAVLEGTLKDTLLLDVIPMSVGFVDQRDLFIRVIMKNTTIPTKKSLIISENFDKAIEDELNRRRHGVSSLAGDADALIRLKNLKIFQGESNDSGESLLLGELPIEFSKPSLNSKTSLEITFDIDANGIPRVSVENRTTRERFERGIEALDPFARSAPARFTEVDLAASRAEADELLNLVDAAIKAHGPHIRREVLEYVEESRRGLKRAMQSRDAAELAGALASFSAATQMKALRRIAFLSRDR